MKSLNDYTQDKQTKLLNDNGAFFAFGQKQFDEKTVKGTKYVSIGAGLICPKSNADNLVQGLSNINDEGIAQDIQENGIPAIIHRELANYESQITNDIDDTVQALEEYGITREQVQAEYGAYFQHCIDNDYF